MVEIVKQATPKRFFEIAEHVDVPVFLAGNWDENIRLELIIPLNGKNEDNHLVIQTEIFYSK